MDSTRSARVGSANYTSTCVVASASQQKLLIKCRATQKGTEAPPCKRSGHQGHASQAWSRGTLEEIRDKADMRTDPNRPH